MENIREKKLSEGLVNRTTLAEVAQALAFVNFAWKYQLAMSIVDKDAAEELGLTWVKKYQKRTGQVEIELDWLHNWILALATFMKHSQKVYDNK